MSASLRFNLTSPAQQAAALSKEMRIALNLHSHRFIWVFIICGYPHFQDNKKYKIWKHEICTFQNVVSARINSFLESSYQSYYEQTLPGHV